jgi:hypothetical protein
MGISATRLVKTLINTAFSRYGRAATAADRFFQRSATSEVGHQCTFQPGFFNQWHKIGVYNNEGRGIKERQTKTIKQKDVVLILNLTGVP